MSRVAVVVPVHDAGPALQETVDSLLAQTADDWVGVLVDDASTDGSRDVAAAAAARHPDRLRLVALDDNVGVVGARRRGIDAVPGTELIVLLDHDDLLDPRYLERMTALHDAARAAGRRVGIVGCDARLLTSGGYSDQTWGERLGWTDDVTLDSLIRQNTIFARALFSRAAYDEVGGLADDVAGSDDIDLWLRMVAAGWEVVVTREPLATYRLTAGNFSRDRVRMGEAKLRVYGRLLARGGLTPDQRREVRRRVRHLRATRAVWLARRAWAAGRRADAVRLSLRALPHAAVALAQDPRHWATRRRRALGAVRGPAAAR